MDCAPQIRDLNRVLGIRRGSFRATPGLLFFFFSLSFLRTHRCAELGCFLQQTRLPARGRGAEQPRGWMNSCPSEPDPSQGEIAERRRRRAGLSGADSLSTATPGQIGATHGTLKPRAREWCPSTWRLSAQLGSAPGSACVNASELIWGALAFSSGWAVLQWPRR